MKVKKGNRYFAKDQERIICTRSVIRQLEIKVSLWFSEKQLLSDGEKERNFQYNESLFALDSFETESVKYCLDKMRKKDNFI